MELMKDGEGGSLGGQGRMLKKTALNWEERGPGCVRGRRGLGAEGLVVAESEGLGGFCAWEGFLLQVLLTS